LSWKSSDPAVGLTLDLIVAGHGVASSPGGRFLVAAFSGVEPAILTARRLLWALQGFAETDRFAGTAAAVLVHSTPDLPALEADSSALLPLENAAPGQILLTTNTAELLKDLPGLSVQTASGAGLSELLWRASEASSSRSSDDEVLTRFIKLNGLEVEAPAPPQEPVVASSQPLPPGTDRALYPLPDALGQEAIKPSAAGSDETDLGFPAPRPRANLRMLIGVACAVAVVTVLIVVFAVSHKRAGNPAAIAAQPASSASTPVAGTVSYAAQPVQSQPSNPVAVTAVATQPGPAKPVEQTLKSRKQEEPKQTNVKPSDAAKSPADQPKVVSGNCDLDANLLPKMLDQAERSREQGNYPAALRQFRAVLACDRNNARARSGLDLTEFAMQHR
jgi:hypothetical protein